MYSDLLYRNGSEHVSQFHKVFVYDDQLREYVRDNLQKKDRVFVNGSLRHLTHTDDEGRRKYSAYIVANSIHKIAKRATWNQNPLIVSSFTWNYAR